MGGNSSGEPLYSVQLKTAANTFCAKKLPSTTDYCALLRALSYAIDDVTISQKKRRNLFALRARVSHFYAESIGKSNDEIVLVLSELQEAIMGTLS